MNCFVGLTDKGWFDYLAVQRPDEVNFWRPGSVQNFRAIEPGAPFLFKLHHPLNFIVGGGFLVRHTSLPLSLAWEIFQENNGMPDLLALRDSINSYRTRVEPDPIIGCTVLTDPFFFAEDDWIAAPADWKPNIVVGKTYDTTTSHGLDLWAKVVARLPRYLRTEETQDNELTLKENNARYGNEYLIHPRLGQGGFRILVTDAYQRRCSITGEMTLPVLQASHIRPYAQSGPHRISNGLLLRSDVHILFDRGYITITPDHHVEVSKRIKEEFENGRHYYAFHGQHLTAMPGDARDWPAKEFLEWHNHNLFLS